MIKCIFFALLVLIFASPSYSDDFFSYLGNFKNLEARFLQENPDGQVLHGVLSLVSSRKFRLEYFAPLPVVFILNGSVFTYYDRDLEEVSHKVLSKDSALIKFANQFQKILSEKSKHNGSKIRFTDMFGDNFVTVTFNVSPVFLESLLIKHPDESKTKIKFLEIVHNKKFPKNLLTEF